MTKKKRFVLPPWVRQLLRSNEYATVRNESEKARAEQRLSQNHADEWRQVAEALEKRAADLAP